MLNTTYIDLNKGQRLSDIISEIPSNRIINKVLTGIGATYSEITNKHRNSIIVVPNLPVIDGKVKDHKNSEEPIIIRSVKNGIRKETIINYLNNSRIPIKKFMTTPESFHIIMEVMELLKIDVYNEYFLLIDECDKMILDSHYRANISDPMNDFFRFKNRSIISATLINPSDSRFLKYDFNKLVVSPLFDFSQNIELLVTNNPIDALSMKLTEISKLKDNGRIFIFFNSLKGILKVLDKVNIKSNYSIFCSDKSKNKLKSKSRHVQSTYTKLDEKAFAKVNLLTSRFYSAVDIYVSNPPHIIIISDAVFLKQTMVDPRTDVVQIKGRFRNTELASLTCISNHTARNFYYTQDQVSKFLSVHKFAYNQVRKAKLLSALDNDKAVISDVLKIMPYYRYMRNESQENSYMKDNFLYENKLTETYSSSNNWIESFKSHSTGYHYFNISVKTYYTKAISGYGQSGDTRNYRDVLTIVVEQIKTAQDSGIKLMEEESLEEIMKEYPEILDGYNLFGEDRLKKVGTSKKRLQKEIFLYNQSIGLNTNFDLVKELKLTFTENSFYSEAALKTKATYFIDKYSLEFSKVKYMSFYKEVMIFSSRTERKRNGISTKGYYLKKVLF